MRWGSVALDRGVSIAWCGKIDINTYHCAPALEEAAHRQTGFEVGQAAHSKLEGLEGANDQAYQAGPAVLVMEGREQVRFALHQPLCPGTGWPAHVRWQAELVVEADHHAGPEMVHRAARVHAGVAQSAPRICVCQAPVSKAWPSDASTHFVFMAW